MNKTAELPAIKKAEPKSQKWTDPRLVKACLEGDQEAWPVLVGKYKKMIYSVPIRHGFNSDDSADIFQSVCEELLTQLPKLRQTRSLTRWILNAASRICLRRKWAEQNPLASAEKNNAVADGALSPEAEEIITQAENDQVFRQVIAELSDQPKQIVQSLFFQGPPKPCEVIAKEICASSASLRVGREAFLLRLRRRAEAAKR